MCAARGARRLAGLPHLSPEQLANPDVRSVLAEVGPSLVAGDEAHCVSTWGHDFRPDYYRLGELVADLGSPAVIAMTATAALPVRQDIVERLRLRDHEVVVTGFARDNIALGVVPVESSNGQEKRWLELAADHSGAGIVYCRTRRSFRLQSRVTHDEFGDGVVTDVEEDRDGAVRGGRLPHALSRGGREPGVARTRWVTGDPVGDEQPLEPPRHNSSSWRKGPPRCECRTAVGWRAPWSR